MNAVRRLHRLPLTALILAASLAATACEDPEEPEPEPQVETLRLTVGTQTITVNARTGNGSGGPIQIPVGNTILSAAFLRADGSADPIVTATGFRLDVTSSNTAAITWTPTTSFTGTLRGVTLGQNSTLTFGLFHLGEGHNEFAWPVPGQVR